MEKLTLRSYLNKNFDTKKKNDYITRYNAIAKTVHLKWFKMGDTGHLVLHFKIPSEKSKNLMYDTLIEFCTSSITPYSLKNCDIKVFSNCPSYVFMNARFASMNGLSIIWAEPLFNKETLKVPDQNDDKTKLPTDIRIERGLFFALYHVSKLTDIELMAFAQKAYKVPNGNTITMFIRNQDWVMEKRGKVGAEFKFDKLYQKMGMSTNNAKNNDSKYVKKVNSISKAGKGLRTSRTSRTKKI